VDRPFPAESDVCPRGDRYCKACGKFSVAIRKGQRPGSRLRGPWASSGALADGIARRMHRVQPLPVVSAYDGVPRIEIPADGHAEQVLIIYCGRNIRSNPRKPAGAARVLPDLVLPAASND
jgi:hypothetical protein